MVCHHLLFQTTCDVNHHYCICTYDIFSHETHLNFLNFKYHIADMLECILNFIILLEINVFIEF